MGKKGQREGGGGERERDERGKERELKPEIQRRAAYNFLSLISGT
jgi:hypothetical protein